MTNSQNTVIIDLRALVHNFRQVKGLLDKRAKIMGIVKSDAYGHGLLPVSETLQGEGIDALGVSYIHEALRLRRGGIRVPIVVLCGIKGADEAREAADHDLTPVIYDLESAGILHREGERVGKRVKVHIKVDTGMGRLGVLDKDLPSFLERLCRLRTLRTEALMSHLSSADEPERDFTLHQIRRFKEAVEVGRAMGFDLPLNNLANSAGIMSYPDSHFDMVRPGIMLYGGLPSPDFSTRVELRPVMSFKGYVLQVRDVPDQTPIGYSRAYRTKGQRKIAILSAGYGDGLPRGMSNRGQVLIGEKRVNIIGNVCMNMVMCDITGDDQIGSQSEAVFLGSQGNETVTGDQMAKWARTISYEIFCSIGQRNAREYVR
ncbi:MAG: alanine racemase [Deltaproteobacteria bacterium]|nr:alanine racemase [Deltaproteobacteria bacterium]MBW2139161.1 alanine racemase [Deltaproteobacteria bacterium]